MEAFDATGALIGNTTAADVAGGLTLSLSIPNIHSIRITQTLSNIAYDDLMFSPLRSAISERPTANAGADQAIHAGQTVTLDGSASSDDSSAALSSEMTAFPIFTPTVPGTYTATLTVSDPFGGVSVDTVVISVITADQFAANQIAQALNLIGSLTLGQVTTRGNRRQALQNYLTQALAALRAGDLDEARNKLMQALERTDGCVVRGV